MSSILKVDQIQNTDGQSALVIASDGSVDSVKYAEELNPSGRTITSTTMSSYEEGTWTPVITGTGNSIAAGELYGSYFRVGNLVTAFLNLNDSSNNTFGSGDITFTGLPFTSTAPTVSTTTAVRYRFITKPASSTQLLAYVNTNSNTVILEWSGSSSFTRLNGSQVNNSTSCSILFGVTYATT